MTLTALVGALVALLPPFAPKPEESKPTLDSEIERLTRENTQLARSHARLVDHIQMLEREILTEQHLTAHWKEAAQRIARQSREAREERERERVRNGFQALQQQQIAAQQNLRAYNGLPPGAQQAQMLAAQTEMQQQMLQAQAALTQQAQPLQWQGLCNCVPSRAQVWAANPAPVDDRIAQLRP